MYVITRITNNKYLQEVFYSLLTKYITNVKKC